VFIIFGPKRLPELAKGIGEAVRQYRQASQEVVAQPASSQPTSRGEEESLVKTAKSLGIETTGKTAKQISEAIVAKGSKS